MTEGAGDLGAVGVATQTGVTGGYVRHRDRMVQESVFEDVQDTLIACRWMAGTTARPVNDPYNPGTYAVVTTTADQVLPLADGYPVNLIDYFPETEGDALAGEPATGKTLPNTMAIDQGIRGESVPRELGSQAEMVPYTFTMAFFATSDAVAMAVLNDLRDRFRGRLVRGEAVALWDYNGDLSAPVNYMDVESFNYRMNAGDTVAPHEVHLYFAELLLVDDVD